MDFRIKCDLGSISPKFYSQLLRAQIPKEQKIQENHQSFFSLLGSVCIKASSKLLVKSTPCLGTEDFVFGTEIYFSFAKFIYKSIFIKFSFSLALKNKIGTVSNRFCDADICFLNALMSVKKV